MPEDVPIGCGGRYLIVWHACDATSTDSENWAHMQQCTQRELESTLAKCTDYARKNMTVYQLSADGRLVP